MQLKPGDAVKYSRRPLSRNERRLIELLFRHKDLARVDLTEATDMTAASITRLVSGLEEMGLLRQKTRRDGARGQPKRLLSLRREPTRAAGVYIHIGHMTAVLIDFSGKVLASRVIMLRDTSAEYIVESTQKLACELIAETGTDLNEFLGVGLAIPANFEEYGTRVRAHAAFANLDGTAIYAAFKGATAWPVYVENDGTAAALGEYLFGWNTSADPLFLVHIGYGLGGGAVLNGSTYRGANGNACLPGALFPYDRPRPTLLDLEATLGKAGLSLAKLEENGEQDTVPKHPVVSGWIDRAATQLVQAVRLISGMFDPEVIVLGGSLPKAVTEALANNLRNRNIEGPSRGLEVAPVIAARLGELNGPVGAAGIPFFKTFFPGSTLERGNVYLDGRTGRLSGRFGDQ